MNHSFISNDGVEAITVIHDGELHVASNVTHSDFDRIKEGVLAGDTSVLDLFDLSKTVASYFEPLSDRLSVANGRVYLDGDEQHNSLTDHLLRVREQGVEDLTPLVMFYDSLLSNPEPHSVEQLYDWLTAEGFTIYQDGSIVGYKSVYSDGNGGFRSINSGKARVNGREVNGQTPIQAGDVVEMPRSEVTHNPAEACSVGLHVGTYAYAMSFTGDTILEVHVNPRDVVSVPSDSGGQKMRVCRYYVVDTIEKPYTEAVRYEESDYDGWGEYEDESELCSNCGEALYSWESDTCEDCLAESDEPYYNPASAAQGNPTVFVPLETDRVKPGDRFADADSRRAGRTLIIESVAGDTATTRSEQTGLLRNVSVDRLLSRKYKRLN